MINAGKRGLTLFAIIAGIILLFIFEISAADKKLRVIKDQAPIHLNPDERSPVLETVTRGTILGLLSPGKFKAFWYYVSHQSASGSVKSGYIHEACVEPLFQAQKIIIIRGEETKYASAFNFCQLEPGFWGASVDKIISLEGEPDQRRSSEDGLEVLEYKRDLKDYIAFLEFIFNHNKLIQIHIELWQIAGVKNEPLKEYNQVKNCLSAKFGSPFEDRVQWENPTFQYDELSWGYAVSLGHLNYQTRWASSGVELSLKLRGENKSICLEFEGTQLAYRDLAKKVTRAGSFRQSNHSLKE